jgi:hypothetical protein
MDKLKKNTHIIKSIVGEVEKKIKRSIDAEEEILIINTFGKLNCNIFKNKSINYIINTISSIIIEEIAINHCEINNVNVHEVLKTVIKNDPQIDTNSIQKTDGDKKVNTNIESVFGYSDIATLVKKVNVPINAVNTIQLLLDTRYRNLSTDGTDSFTWDYINQLTTSPGTVNSFGNIRDIISMAIMNIKIPNVLDANWDYDLISISIEELISQSVIAHENKRYHFLSCIDRSKSNSRWLSLCCDDYYKGIYNFNTPITTLNTLTLKFGSPLESIKFDKDRLLGNIIYGSPTIIQFDEVHKLTSNDIIYIDNFTTSNLLTDYNIIKNINNINGNVSTVVSPTSISILVDSSSIINNNIIKQYSIFFGSKRMFIPIEFKFLST